MTKPASETTKITKTDAKTAPTNGNGSTNTDLGILANVTSHVGLLRQELTMILHAQSCAGNGCQVSRCATMRRTQEHVAQCSGDKCQRADCRQFRVVLEHWDACQKQECLICGHVLEQYALFYRIIVPNNVEPTPAVESAVTSRKMKRNGRGRRRRNQPYGKKSPRGDSGCDSVA